MPASTEVSLKNQTTGNQVFYTNYADARYYANSGDVITIWADLDEQIILKDGVDIIIAPGRIIKKSGAPTIIDNGVKCVCKIFGEGIIQNIYTSTKSECVKLTDDESEVYIECDYVEGFGGTTPNSRNAATINIVHAAKFSLICNNIYSHTNTSVLISDCDNFYIKCKSIESGTLAGNTNIGPAVIYVDGTGSIFADKVVCNGYGSCLEHADGKVFAKILQLTTLDDETSAHPTILLDNGTGDQELILYFDEILNLNTTEGSTITAAEGNAILNGRRIYSQNGLSLDLGANANVTCSEIVSDGLGISIHNHSTEKILLNADKIILGSESNGDYAITASGDCSLRIINARIENLVARSGNVGIYINPDEEEPFIELHNVTIALIGDVDGGETIYFAGSSVGNIYNYYLFVNKEINGEYGPPNLLIGTGTSGNYKYIVSPYVYG